MDILFEQKLIQNTALAMELLHAVILEHYKKNKATTGLKFPLIFLVLPLLFQKRTTNVLYNKASPGSIYKAISENREIPIGLQNRMEAYFENTFDAISLGLSVKLFAIDYPVGEIVPIKKNLVCEDHSEDTKCMLAAAKRIGQTFSELTIEEIAQTLKVVF